MNEVKIGLRNVRRYLSRYTLLVLTISIGFALALTLIGLSSGTSESLRGKSLRYFAGDVTLTGYVKNGSPKIDSPEELLSKVRETYSESALLNRRTVYYGSDAVLNYDGTNFPQRRVIGLDFEKERSLFDAMDFVEGGLPRSSDKNAVVISNIAAQKLKLRVGDQLILFLTTDSGQKNDVRLLVKGIFNEGSIFSYVSYLDIETLNKTMNREIGSISDIGLILPDQKSSKPVMDSLYQNLKDKFLVFDPVKTKEELSAAVAGDYTGGRLAILDLDTHLSQIKNTLDAIFVVTWLVLVVFLSIMTIGLGNTFNMVVRERMKEIATLRAMGMQKNSLLMAYYFESLFVIIASLGIGAIGGFVVSLVVQSLTLVPNTVTALFLSKGHLSYVLPWEQVGLVVISIMIFSVLGVTKPLRFVTKVSPVKALSQA